MFEDPENSDQVGVARFAQKLGQNYAAEYWVLAEYKLMDVKFFFRIFTHYPEPELYITNAKPN